LRRKHVPLSVVTISRKVARVDEMKNIKCITVRRLEEKKMLRESTGKWEDNIKVEFNAKVLLCDLVSSDIGTYVSVCGRLFSNIYSLKG
jgi:hypothetical protein